MVTSNRPAREFYWTESSEPHAIRRREILKKHPEIKSLYGADPMVAVKVAVAVLLQMLVMRYVIQLSWMWVVVISYVVSGTINHALLLAIHEIGHNLAFGHQHPSANKMLSMVANLPLGVPIAIGYKKYHAEHHRYQGTDGLDVDLPTWWEARLFSSTLGKILWITILPFTYFIRPILIRPKPVSLFEVANNVVQIGFDCLVWYYFGNKAVFYMFGGFIMGIGLHPMSGHLISEHYIFQRGNETYSYYGIMNYLTFNEGYHNEHHDFPAVPGSRLPMVSKIAPEFYENLPTHDSWIMTLVNFVFRDDLSPFSRIKRKRRPEQGAVHQDD